MLVVGLVGGGPLAREGRRVLVPVTGVARLVGEAGVVVLGFVVVPGDHPCRGRVRGLQLRISLVLGVTRPVVVESLELVEPRPGRGGVATVWEPALRVVLIDVVTDVDDEIEVVGGDRAIRRPVAVLEVLAAGQRETQRGRAGTGGRRGTGPADRADHCPGTEPVEVHPGRLQATDVDVHRVRRPRGGGLRPHRHDIGEPVVGGELPVHWDVTRGQARDAGRRRQPRPNDHTVGQRVPAGDPESEHAVPDAGYRGRGPQARARGGSAAGPAAGPAAGTAHRGQQHSPAREKAAPGRHRWPAGIPHSTRTLAGSCPRPEDRAPRM